jgi:hypothetical protein
MKRLFSVLNNENGSPLVIVVLVLVLLTLIGLSVLNTTSVETQIAGHHRRHKVTFYGADGGTEVACELLEQNIGCSADGFTDNTGGNGAVIGLDPVPAAFPCPDANNTMKGVRVNNLFFYQNSTRTEVAPNIDSGVNPSDFSDIFYPANMSDACGDWPHTRLTVGEDSTVYAKGSAIQQLAGYEGKGKGAAGGGGHIFYTIFSERVENGDDVTISIGWRHAIGQEGGCNY